MFFFVVVFVVVDISVELFGRCCLHPLEVELLPCHLVSHRLGVLQAPVSLLHQCPCFVAVVVLCLWKL